MGHFPAPWCVGAVSLQLGARAAMASCRRHLAAFDIDRIQLDPALARLAHSPDFALLGHETFLFIWSG